MKGGWLLSLGVMGMGKEKKVARRERGDPLNYQLLLSSSQITSRRAGYQPRFFLPKCQMVLSRPHKIGVSCSLRRGRWPAVWKRQGWDWARQGMREGRRGSQAGQSLPPLSWLPPTSLKLSRDPSTGLGVSKARANVKQKLKG